MRKKQYLLSSEFWCDNLGWDSSGGGIIVVSGVWWSTGGVLNEAHPELISDFVPSSVVPEDKTHLQLIFSTEIIINYT